MKIINIYITLSLSFCINNSFFFSLRFPLAPHPSSLLSATTNTGCATGAAAKSPKGSMATEDGARADAGISGVATGPAAGAAITCPTLEVAGADKCVKTYTCTFEERERKGDEHGATQCL